MTTALIVEISITVKNSTIWDYTCWANHIPRTFILMTWLLVSNHYFTYSCHYLKYHSLLSWVLRKIYCGSLSFQGTHYSYYIIFWYTSPKAWYQDPLHLIPDKSIVTVLYYLLWLKISKYLILLSMMWIGCELVPKVLTFHALPAANFIIIKI